MSERLLKIHGTHDQINEKTGDALLIHLTYVLGLKTWKIRLLVFEDAEYKDQPKIKIYDLKKETVKQILISQELYDKII